MIEHLAILVTGSRFINDRGLITQPLAAYRSKCRTLTIIHGNCPRGVDAVADKWAVDHADHLIRVPALWERHQKKAGPIRNNMMAILLTQYHADRKLCLGFPLPGYSASGTIHCMNACRTARIEVVSIT